MANILVATVPGAGHVNPMLTVVTELVRRGHTVHWYTGQVFQSKIEAAGAVYEPMQYALDHGGVPVEEAFPELRGKSGRQAFIAAWKAIFIDMAPRHMRDLQGILARFPADLLLCDETQFGMGLVREKCALPLVWVATSVYFFRSPETAPIGLGLLPDGSWLGQVRNRFLYALADQLLLRELRLAADAMRRSAGLAAIPAGALQNITRAPDRYLMGTVPAFEYPRRQLQPGTRFVGPLLSPPPQDFVLPPWWDEVTAAHTVIHVTEGTVNYQSQRLLAPVLQALAQMDVLVVATTGGANAEQMQLPFIPPNARIAPFIPHAILLPHVDVMVTNGGYGGVQMALANGVPMVVAGATEEKPEVAAHVEYAGAGINLRTQTPTSRQLQQAVQSVLANPGYAAHARSLQDEYARHNGPCEAADEIERML